MSEWPRASGVSGSGGGQAGGSIGAGIADISARFSKNTFAATIADFWRTRICVVIRFASGLSRGEFLKPEQGLKSWHVIRIPLISANIIASRGAARLPKSGDQR